MKNWVKILAWSVVQYSLGILSGYLVILLTGWLGVKETTSYIYAGMVAMFIWMTFKTPRDRENDERERKNHVMKFWFYWYNHQGGTNTEQGYDEWIKAGKPTRQLKTEK